MCRGTICILISNGATRHCAPPPCGATSHKDDIYIRSAFTLNILKQLTAHSAHKHFHHYVYPLGNYDLGTVSIIL